MSGKPRFPLSHVDATNALNRQIKKIFGLQRRVTGNPPSQGGIGLGLAGSLGASGIDGHDVPTPVNCTDAVNKCYVDNLIANLVDVNGLVTSGVIVERISEKADVGNGTNIYTSTGFIPETISETVTGTVNDDFVITFVSSHDLHVANASVVGISLMPVAYWGTTQNWYVDGVLQGTIAINGSGVFSMDFDQSGFSPGTHALTIGNSAPRAEVDFLV